LPTIESPEAFLASHQVAIAQLAIEYCNALVNDGQLAAAYFNGFDFDQAPATAYAGNNRDQIIDPLIDNVMGLAIQTQPDFTVVRDELGYALANGTRPANLVDRLVGGGSADTRAVAKGVCAAVLGSAVTLVQ
jgi:hypothetical protein